MVAYREMVTGRCVERARVYGSRSTVGASTRSTRGTARICAPTRPVVAVAACLVAVLAVSGCGRSGSRARAGKSPTAPAASASPNPSAYLAALRATLLSATIPQGALAALGGPAAPKDERPATYATTAVCGLAVGADNDGLHEAYYRQWLGGTWSVQNVVHGYQNATGADVVKVVQHNAQSCAEYTDNGLPRRILGQVTLPALPGVEAQYAYCEEVKGSDETFIGCVAFLARRNLVSYVYVVHGGTQQPSSAALAQVAGLAAEALRAAG
jgi:hypothetical protein